MKPLATRGMEVVLDFLLLVFGARNVGLVGASTRRGWQVQARHHASNIHAQPCLLDDQL